jgi:hypothetical protein
MDTSTNIKANVKQRVPRPPTLLPIRYARTVPRSVPVAPQAPPAIPALPLPNSRSPLVPVLTHVPMGSNTPLPPTCVLINNAPIPSATNAPGPTRMYAPAAVETVATKCCKATLVRPPLKPVLAKTLLLPNSSTTPSYRPANNAIWPTANSVG